MKLRGAFAVALLAIAVVAVAPAYGASTRAEYVAQVDPICQSFAAPMGAAWAAYQRNANKAERHLTRGTFKTWTRLIRRTARSLNRLSQTHTSMVDQIAAVPALASDTATVDAWLNYLGQEAGYESSAAAALRKLKIGKANHISDQADQAEAAGKRTISGFGFQVCGTGVVV